MKSSLRANLGSTSVATAMRSLLLASPPVCAGSWKGTGQDAEACRCPNSCRHAKPRSAACLDKEALARALTSTTFSRPNFHFGFFAADFTAHTTVRLFDAIPELANYVAPQRGHPKWKKTSPADAEVYIDEATCDVCVRRIDNHEHLGSFERAWVF